MFEVGFDSTVNISFVYIFMLHLAAIFFLRPTKMAQNQSKLALRVLINFSGINISLALREKDHTKVKKRAIRLI
jgi:hypothetical protein